MPVHVTQAGEAKINLLESGGRREHVYGSDINRAHPRRLIDPPQDSFAADGTSVRIPARAPAAAPSGLPHVTGPCHRSMRRSALSRRSFTAMSQRCVPNAVPRVGPPGLRATGLQDEVV